MLERTTRGRLLAGMLAACGCSSSDGGDAGSADAACQHGWGCDEHAAHDADTCVGPGRSSTEQWYDGVDSDCDGREEPYGCDATPHPETVETASTADEGVDLIVVQYAACSCCYGCTVTLRIANAGTTALESASRVAVLESRDAYEALVARGQDGERAIVQFDGPLGPGEVSQPASLQVDLGRSAQRSGYFIVVDPFDAIAESDETNNGLDADGSNVAVCE